MVKKLLEKKKIGSKCKTFLIMSKTKWKIL